MINQDKFVETFGIDAWRQMISFSGIAEQFKEFWTSKYEKPEHTGIDFISDLDKIRAEIKQEIIPRNSDQYDHEAMWQNMGLRMALKVIDKYKTESEEV